MHPDERAIRDTQRAWFDATEKGDLPRLLTLMTEDVVFLGPGQPPFGRETFATSFSAGHKHVRIHCIGEFEEVVVSGDVAYTRGRLTVTVQPRAGGASKRLSGYTLSVYRRSADGTWLLARDANLLAPEIPPDTTT